MPYAGSTPSSIRHSRSHNSGRRILSGGDDIYLRYHGAVNSRHRRTLGRIFAEPTPADLRWRDIEALMGALGAEVSEVPEAASASCLPACGRCFTGRIPPR
jgi:hypothetical protein